jgi:hypothetical protein
MASATSAARKVDIYGYFNVGQLPPGGRSYAAPIPVHLTLPPEPQEKSLDDMIWDLIDELVPDIQAKLPGWHYLHHTY